MRWVKMTLLCAALAGCGRAEEEAPGETATRASGIAFAYRYDFRLPSARIAAAQEAHAQACEALGPARCRITGMTYRLDGSGQVSASLDLGVAASIARAFGRRGVAHVEGDGGALTGAEIVGTDVAAPQAAARRDAADSTSDLADVDRRLARGDLPADARRDLLARRDALVEARRGQAAAVADAGARLETTPVAFTYQAGSGVGLPARLSEAAHTGYLSLTWTLATALTAVAYVGPPLVLLLLLALFWHHVGRRWWARAFPRAEG